MGNKQARGMPREFGRFRSWPITAARELEGRLREMGLKVPATAIDGTSSGEACLSDALVSVGLAGRGGTGSFVSSEGLIMTNWHVAHDAVRQASLACGSDYVKDGFVARSRREEVRGPNYEVWITKSCEDVSASVLEALGGVDDGDLLKRSNAVRDAKHRIASGAESRLKAASAAPEGVRCDVQEMFPNETYVLFCYERLRDVRIAYSPPSCLGNFGGDADNFEWPRHTADFALLRAYVGPDGSAAEYDEANVPYSPASHIAISARGVNDGDFVFLLGFPGSTMRYAPTSRLQYSEAVAVPSMIDEFRRKLALIAAHETRSPEAALKMAGAKKSLSNEFKRSTGKLAMMRKLQLLAEREREEAALVSKAPRARDVLERLRGVYDALAAMAPTSDALSALRGVYHGSALLAAAHASYEASLEVVKPDAERETPYRDRNRPFMIQRLLKRLGDAHPPLEVDLVRDALAKASDGDGDVGVDAATFLPDGADLDGEVRRSLQAANDGGGLDSSDVFVGLAKAIYPAYARDRDRHEQRGNLG